MNLPYRPAKSSMSANFLSRWEGGVVIPISWKGNASAEGSSNISAGEEWGCHYKLYTFPPVAQ